MAQSHCPYKRCELKCSSKSTRKARYACITKNWRRPVTKPVKHETTKVDWLKLRELDTNLNFYQESVE
jgi:hypothetical protein